MGLRRRSLLSDEQFFFVTTTVKNFTPIFKRSKYCDILVKNITHYQQKYEFEILAYVIMPSHFHWIVKTNPKKGTISGIMKDVKKYTAWDILEELGKESNEVIVEFSKEVKPKQRKQFWIHRFDDQVIRNNKMFWIRAPSSYALYKLFSYIHYLFFSALIFSSYSNSLDKVAPPSISTLLEDSCPCNFESPLMAWVKALGLLLTLAICMASKYNSDISSLLPSNLPSVSFINIEIAF